jgi:hypothetical protein
MALFLRLVVTVCLLQATAWAKASGSQAEFGVVEQLEVMVPLSDGALLATNLFLPDGKGPWPAVLERTPYDKGGGDNDNARFFAERGYAYVVQDVRGRFDSEGVFDPVRAEASDGYEVQAWVAAQPWSDGSIATTGGSYVGMTQWQPAPLGHPAVKSMLTVVTGASFYDVAHGQGALPLALGALWAMFVTDPRGYDASTRDLDAALKLLPLSTLDVGATGRQIPFFRNWLAHPTRDEYWKPVAADRYEQIDVPVLHVGGWYDIFAVDTIADYEGMVARAPSKKTR